MSRTPSIYAVFTIACTPYENLDHAESPLARYRYPIDSRKETFERLNKRDGGTPETDAGGVHDEDEGTSANGIRSQTV